MDTKKLRQKILDLAIHGKLVPQDPNDEPASVLLERIRAEKERLIKEGKIKRSKKSSSDTPHYENVPFEVPESWKWCIVDDFAYVASGSTPSKDSFVEKGVPYIKMYNLRNQKIDFNFHPQYITREVHEGKLQRSKTEVGDLIMNIVGPPLGKLAIIPPSLPESNFNQAAVLIRPYFYKDVLVKYLFYYLSEMSEINSISTKGSAGQVNISLTQSQNMRIALPPLEEQKRIISTVENLFQIVDIIDNGSIDISMAISKVKAKILDLAIHGKLVSQDPSDEPAIELLKRINPSFVPCDNAHYENVPEGWTEINVGELAQYTNGKAFQPSDWEPKGLPIIRIQNLNDENCKYNYTSIDHEEKYRITNGDLLFAWAASLGVYIWKGDDAWLNQHIFKVEPLPFIDKQFLYYLFQYLISEFYNRSHGSGMVHITKKEFETTIALLPPLSEQSRIVKSIESYYAALDNISANL
jgi:type I restriction enzyme S subunit